MSFAGNPYFACPECRVLVHEDEAPDNSICENCDEHELAELYLAQDIEEAIAVLELFLGGTPKGEGELSPRLRLALSQANAPDHAEALVRGEIMRIKGRLAMRANL